MAKKRKNKSRKKIRISPLLKFVIVIIALVVTSVFIGRKDSLSDYSRLKGLSGAALKTELHQITRNHKNLDFDENTTARYWWDNYFKQTDWNPNNYYWDMYSNDKYSTYLGGNVQNREHVMPRSWWGYRKEYSSYDANGDLHNLYPANSEANSAKGNLPLGEVGITVFNNGVSKVGNNTFPNGYRGQVFEPADEYKGDFARIYFYMVTCYQDYADNWRSDATKSMIEKNSYPSLKPWAIKMLLQWHKEDPVSRKEIDRNNEVYYIQGNRNPFIDHPELVEYIWGDKSNIPYQIEEENNADQSPQTDFISYCKQFFAKLFREYT